MLLSNMILNINQKLRCKKYCKKKVHPVKCLIFIHEETSYVIHLHSHWCFLRILFLSMHDCNLCKNFGPRRLGPHRPWSSHLLKLESMYQNDDSFNIYLHFQSRISNLNQKQRIDRESFKEHSHNVTFCHVVSEKGVFKFQPIRHHYSPWYKKRVNIGACQM